MTQHLVQATGLQAQIGIAKSQFFICSHSRKSQKEGPARAVAQHVRRLTADPEKTQ